MTKIETVYLCSKNDKIRALIVTRTRMIQVKLSVGVAKNGSTVVVAKIDKIASFLLL